MWRWTVLLCILFLYGRTSSQPVKEDSENARKTRQLDIGECCPCPSPGQGLAAHESSMTSDGFARASDIDDCPCRPRSIDSEGSSSMFFPTSRRSDDFVRPINKNGDIKPLLHPEVDLASSVLETLREVTDEEYEEALARDAARNMAKAAEESIFEDALPEASNGNIVTIIVNPKHTDSFEDDIPQESRVHESRCIHAPLESESPNLGQMRVALKPPSLLREIFGLPRINKPAGTLHKNLLDMDNGASNIQESVVNVNDDKVNTKSVLGTRNYSPLLKFDTKIKDLSTNLKNNADVDNNVKKLPNFNLPPLKKLKDLIPNRPALEGKEKINPLSSIPKMRFNNPLLKVKGKDTEDLSLSASNIHEQAKKSFFQTKSHLENLLQNTKPVGLKNLLKLKDVEFVPLKDLIPKAVEKPELKKPKFAWPEAFNKGNSFQTPINNARSTEIIETIPKNSKHDSFDAEVSPSNAIQQVHDENCINTAFKITETVGEDPETKTALSDTIDAASSPSEIQEVIGDPNNNELANNQSSELSNNSDDCNTKTLSDTETNLPHSKQIFIENEPSGNNEEELNIATSKETTPGNAKSEEDQESVLISKDDCITNSNEGDSMTDSTNKVIDVVEQTDKMQRNVDDPLVNQTPETKVPEPCSEERSASDTPNILNIDSSKLIKPLSLDETLSTIRENIRKHIESLKIPKNSPQPANIINQPISSSVIENQDFSLMTNEKLDSDSQNEETIQVSKSVICDDDLNIESEPVDNKVSMQDLQKMSDAMLKEEQERESNTLNCNETSQEVIDSKTEVNSGENEIADTQQSANTQNKVIMNPQNIVDISENINNEKNACKSDLMVPKPSFEPEQDAYVEASEVVMRKTPQRNNGNENINTEQSDNTQNEVITDPQNIIDITENVNNEKNVCKNDLMVPKQSFEQEQDANVEASEVFMRKTPQSNNKNENTDTEQSDNTQNEVIINPQNINNEKNACKSDLMLPKQSFDQEHDANVEASEVVMRIKPQSKNMNTLPLLNQGLQTTENNFGINFPLPEISDIKLAPLPTLDELKLKPLPTLDEVKLAPLPTLDEITHSLNDLFNTPARDVDNHSALEAAAMTDMPNILAPTMSTDASVKHFQSLLPPLRLEDVDLDILQLNPKSNLLPTIPTLDLHSFRTKLPLPTDLRIKPLKLQSAFEDNGGLLGATLSIGQRSPWEGIPGLDDFGSRMKSTNKLSKTLRTSDPLKLKSNLGIGDLSSSKNGLKSTQHSLGSKIRGGTTKPVNLQGDDLLEVISRNHEDFNDKLRALHIDFNDRLETMRNDLFDQSIFGSGESRSTKSFSTFSTKGMKPKLKSSQPQSLSSRRESKKTVKPRQKEVSKFKMPTSASVPVPKTVQVPELKATLTKSPGLGTPKSTGVNSIFQNIETSQPKESTITLWKQASKKLPITDTRLRKTTNRFKDSKTEVSFSTTPRPTLASRSETRKLSTPSLISNLGKNTGRLGQRMDHKGSPSEMRHSITSPPISRQLDEQNLGNYGFVSESRQSSLPTLKLGGQKRTDNLEQSKLGKNLQSWPKASESSFLSKVREAVKQRMSKVNSPAIFRKTDGKSLKSSVIQNDEVLNSNTDMSRSASTDFEVVEAKPLKENVSYKCTMVCTKE